MRNLTSNHLTGGGILTIVQRAMLKSIQRVGDSALTGKHRSVCFLLPLVLLCNPFTVTSNCSGKADIHHMPSYRATIASAELLKAKNPEGLDGIAIPASEFGPTFANELSSLTDPLEPLHDRTLLPSDRLPSGNLWFRPPPIA